MSIKSGRFLLAVGVLGSMLAVTPALAETGHGGGGGGHASGGHSGGRARGAAGGAHFAAGRGFAGGGVAHSYGAGFRGSAYVGGRGAYGYPGGYARHGYSTGAYWGGGYWGGGYWPRAYYGLGFAWFLPILPAVYATYWYGGVPYYYANDVYYTWDASQSGYTATDPPPVADAGAGSGGGVAPGAGPDDGQGQAQAQAQPQPQYQGQEGQGGAPQIFMYPKNGQSEEQQSTDKRECQKWASDQAGQSGENSSDFRRALAACVEGRGYSAN